MREDRLGIDKELMEKIERAEEDIKADRIRGWADILREEDREAYIGYIRCFGFRRCKNCDRLVFVSYKDYCKRCFEKTDGPIRGYELRTTPQFEKGFANLPEEAREMVAKRLRKLEKHPFGSFLNRRLKLRDELERYYCLHLGIGRYSAIYTLNEELKIINLLALIESPYPFQPGLFFMTKEGKRPRGQKEKWKERW